MILTGSDSAEPHRTPEPEGPDQISKRMQRTRDGLPGRLKKALLNALGLEDLSPKRSKIILLVALAEFGLLGLGFFTELPSSWLITAALAILSLVFHQEKEDEENEAELDVESGPEVWKQNHDDRHRAG